MQSFKSILVVSLVHVMHEENSLLIYKIFKSAGDCMLHRGYFNCMLQMQSFKSILVVSLVHVMHEENSLLIYKIFKSAGDCMYRAPGACNTLCIREKFQFNP